MKTRIVSLLALLGFAGCASRETRPDYTTTLARFFLEQTSGAPAGTMTLPLSGVQIPVGSKPVLSEADIAEVVVAQVELGKCLALRLSGAATRDLYRLTASNQGRRLVLTINGEPLGARRIEAPFTDGAVLVFVEMPDEKLPTLVENLRRTTEALQRKLGRDK